MPIINRPPSESEVEEPKEVSGIISRPKTNFDEKTLVDDVELDMVGTEPKPKPPLSFKWVKWGLLTLVILVVAVFAIQSLQSISRDSQVSSENIALDVDRLIRIDSVVALLEKKIEQNQASLQRSEKLGDKVLVDTMRLALAQNLIDLEKHQDSFIDVLVGLQSAYLSNSDAIVSALREQLKSSSDNYKLGRVDTINKTLGLIESVPEGKAPLEYFNEKLKKQNKGLNDE